MGCVESAVKTFRSGCVQGVDYITSADWPSSPTSLRSVHSKACATRTLILRALSANVGVAATLHAPPAALLLRLQRYNLLPHCTPFRNFFTTDLINYSIYTLILYTIYIIYFVFSVCVSFFGLVCVSFFGLVCVSFFGLFRFSV